MSRIVIPKDVLDATLHGLKDEVEFVDESGEVLGHFQPAKWERVFDPPLPSEEDLKFISQNQQLEGFPGEITDAVRQHRTDWAELEAVARRFGAQMPKRPADAATLEDLQTPR